MTDQPKPTTMKRSALQEAMAEDQPNKSSVASTRNASKLKSEEAKEEPATGAPPCALCGRQPHPDSGSHSYRPMEPKPATGWKVPEDLLEWAWTIIANAHGGDWGKESRDWQDAAIAWTDAYFGSLPRVSKTGSEQPNVHRPPDQPKPTGEWTKENMAGKWSRGEEWIMAEHNAALVAKDREHDELGSKYHADDLREMAALREHNRTLQQQLAAEREKRPAVTVEMFMKEREQCKQLQQQLATEREKLRLANIDALQTEAELNDLRTARDDESKLIRKLSDDVMELSQQLAAEREKVQTRDLLLQLGRTTT